MKTIWLFSAAIAATLFGMPALADTVPVKGGTASVDVSATQMSRLLVQGEKITSVRSLDDPNGPQVLIQNDAATGDVFIGFDGDTSGRTFSLFVTTDGGETAQVLLHPGDGPAKTIELVPETKAASRAAPMLRTNGYSETVTAFMKLMFNDQVTEGVTYEPASERPSEVNHLSVRTLGYYHAAGLRGIVLAITNRDTAPRALPAEQFLVRHVMAAGVSNELLEAGDTARVYIEEEAQ